METLQYNEEMIFQKCQNIFFFKCYKRDLVWFCVKLVFIDVVEEASLVSYLYARKAMQQYVFLQSDWLKVHKGEGNSVKVYQTLITRCECGDAALLGKISRTWSWMCLFYIFLSTLFQQLLKNMKQRCLDWTRKLLLFCEELQSFSSWWPVSKMGLVESNLI